MSALRLALRLSGRRLIRDWWRWLVGGALLGAVLTLGALVLASVVDDAPELIAIRHTPAAIAPHTFNVSTGPPNQVTITTPGSTARFSSNSSAADPNHLAPTSTVSVIVPKGANTSVGRAAMATMRSGSRETNVAVTDLAGTDKTDLVPVVAGRTPSTPRDIALPQAVLDQLDIGVGDDLEVTAGAMAGRHFSVVGVVRDRTGFDPAVHRNWARVAATALDGVALDGRLVTVDLPGRAGASGASGGEITDSPLRIDDASSWQDPSSIGLRGMIAVLASILLLIPLLLPILAVSTILSVGQEARSREQSLFAQLGAHRAVASAPALGEGLMIGAVASIVALLGAKALGRDLSPTLVTAPVIVTGLVGGVIVAIAAQRRAHRLMRSSGGPMVWRPWRLVVVGALAIMAAAGVGMLSRNGLSMPFGTPLLLLALGLLLIQSLATALTRLQSRLAPTAAARAALASAWRLRWMSAPASLLIGLASAVFVAIAFGTAATSTTVGDSGRVIAILPGPVIDAHGRHVAPKAAVDSVVRGLPVATITPLTIAFRTDCQTPPQLWTLDTSPQLAGALVAIADRTTMRSITGRPIPTDVGAIALGAANTDHVMTCRGLSEETPLALKGPLQSVQGTAPSIVVVTPASAAASHLRSTDAVTWMVRTTRGLTNSEQRILAARLSAVGLRADPTIGAVSNATVIVRRVAFATFLVLTALALIVAAAERRENRELLRAAGVRPTDEAIAEAVASGGLAAAGVGSTVITIALLGTAGALASGSDWSGLPDALGEQRWAFLTVLLTPVAAALVAFVVFASRRTPEISWWKRGDDRTRTGE